MNPCVESGTKKARREADWLAEADKLQAKNVQDTRWDSNSNGVIIQINDKREYEDILVASLLDIYFQEKGRRSEKSRI